MFFDVDLNNLDDKNSQKPSKCKKALIWLVVITAIIIIAVVAFIIIAKPGNENKQNKEKEEEEIEYNTTEYLIADFKVENDTIINTGLVSTAKITNSKIDGNYFKGGVIKLDKDYNNATIEVIVDYNMSSSERIFTSFAYYGGALIFNELSGKDSSKQRMIGISYAGGAIETGYVLPNHNYQNKYYSGKSLYPGEDIFFAITTNSGNDSVGLFGVQVNDDYREKKRWCERIRSSINLSSDHRIKEIKIFSMQFNKKTLLKEFQKTNIKLSTENFTIDNYENPNNFNIDNSKYQSLHIIKKPQTIYLGYKYSLSAIPYPFNINHNSKSDQFEVKWNSSDKNIAEVVDGLVIPKKTGTVTIKAYLVSTNIFDEVTIEIIEKPKITEKKISIPSDYKSNKGNSFSKTDYIKTTNAIYDAIDEYYKKGYNYILFPKIDFFAAPTGTTFFIPTKMTIEFPKGSTFHMMPSDLSKNKGYTYFSIGWKTWSDSGGYFYDIPKEKATVETGSDGQVTGYFIEDVHLIIDKYYGEFYKEGGTIKEFGTGAKQYKDGCVFINIGKNAKYSSVELHTAIATSGFFIIVGGSTYANEIKDIASCSMKYSDFVQGRLDDKGQINDSLDKNLWITTNSLYPITTRIDGTDFLKHYTLANIYSSSTETSYHFMASSTQHLYDIAWYDKNKDFIQIDRWHYIDDTYDRPNGAAYYKVSIQQENLPTVKDCTDNSTYIRFMPAGGAQFCEVRNTKLYHSADGLLSITGETENFWIHDNYLYNDGYLWGWSLDLEDGWNGIRGTILENNIFRKFGYSTGRNIEYYGPDSGILALSGGFNTFVINNYIGAIAQCNYNVANTHIIHNTIGCLYGSYTNSTFHEIRSKIYSHVYNNVIGADYFSNKDTTQNGVNYLSDNYFDYYVNSISYVDELFKEYKI